MENLFLYKIEREELENNVKIISYYIDENCKKIIKEDFMNYEILANEKQFLEKKIELEKLNIKKEDKIFYNLKKEKVVKLIFETKESFIFFKGFFKENFVETYELDLIFEHKYLINNDVKIAQNFNKEEFKLFMF